VLKKTKKRHTAPV